MKRFFNYYHHLLHKYKYPTQILSGGFIWSIGDSLSQLITTQGDDFLVDWKRIRTMAMYGMLISAPSYAFWYSALDRWGVCLFAAKGVAVGKAEAGRLMRRLHAWKIIAFKLTADMLIFDPIYLLIFFGATGLLEGGSLEAIGKKIKENYVKTLLIDIAVWFPIQTINFRIVPVAYQPLLVQSCNVGWNAYLSFVQHANHK